MILPPQDAVERYPLEFIWFVEHETGNFNLMLLRNLSIKQTDKKLNDHPQFCFQWNMWSTAVKTFNQLAL